MDNFQIHFEDISKDWRAPFKHVLILNDKPKNNSPDDFLYEYTKQN